MICHPELISTAEGIASLAKSLKGQEIIAFDTEFIRENTFYPIVEIIQVATDQDSWLVDAAAFKKGFRPGPQGGFDPGLKPLLEIFEDKSILKIVHAAQGDQECLFTSFASIATPSLDTAIAASLCGYGEGIGLGRLLQAVLGVNIKKGYARTNWSVRPLPEQLLTYAHADVEHLVEVGRNLLAQLEKLGRKDWALALSAKFEEKNLYEPNAEDITLKLSRGGKVDKRGYSALAELVRWREARVRQLNVPRRWVADDAVLLDIAHVRPKDMEALAAFRGLNKGELRTSGQEILGALRRATEAEDVKLPRLPKPDIPSSEESQVLDLLRCYLGILADRHKIAARHLMTVPQLLPLLRSKIEKASDLSDRGILSPDAAQLIGDELIALIQGRRALRVKGTEIEIVELKDVT